MRGETPGIRRLAAPPAVVAPEAQPVRPDPAVPGACDRGSGRARPAGATRVRPAGPGDIGAVVDLVAQAQGESGFARFPFAADKVATAARRYLGQPARAAVLLAERAGAATGLCVTVVDELLTSHAKVGTVLILYVRPAARGSFAAVRLLRHSRRWAAAQGAEALMVHATGGIAPDRTHRLLTRMGFGLSGGNYAMHWAPGSPGGLGGRGVSRPLQEQASHRTEEGR